MRMIFDGCSSFEHSVRNLAKTLRITGSRGEIKHGDRHPLTADLQCTHCQLDQVLKKLDRTPLL